MDEDEEPLSCATEDLPSLDVRRLRDELISQGATLEATFPPPSLPGPSASCATPIDPLIGHVDAAAFGGWVGQHCTFSR